MQIVHLSADFPDPLAPGKTPAVARLIDLAPEHDHAVWSLNRVSWRRGIHAVDFGPNRRAVAYGAPPHGIGLAGGLARLADFVLEDVARLGLKPDAVHAHKLSVEGLAGETVAAALGVPLIVSSQGNSDLKILRSRRDLTPRWRRIWRGAAAALPFAPWTRDRLTALLGPREGFTAVLPCPLTAETPRAPRAAGRPLIRTAFHLAGHRNKNAAALIRAAGEAGRRIPDLRLEIAGGGDPEAFAELSERAAAEAPGRAALVGPVAGEAMPDFLNAAAGFALPSRRESYGMVFAEALLAGCPVMHPKGAAIDGYLPEGEASFAVDAGDPSAIADGLERLVREEAALKARLAAMQDSGGLEMFRREAIAATYRDALAAAARARA